MAVSIALVGGRPAMISAATGSVALVVAPLARAHGLQYLLAAVILAGRSRWSSACSALLV
jgi:SulP family sulfate permease